MYRPRGYKEIKAIRFHENRHMKMVSFSTLLNCNIYTPCDIPDTQFRYRLRRPQGQCVAGKILLRKMTSAIKTATFRLVAQCFKQLRHRMPLIINSETPKFCSLLFYSKFGPFYKISYYTLSLRNNVLFHFSYIVL